MKYARARRRRCIARRPAGPFMPEAPNRSSRCAEPRRHVPPGKRSRRRKAVRRRVVLTRAPGRTLALVGESGSGKSITALSVVRLLLPHEASVIGGTHPASRGEELLGRQREGPYARIARRCDHHGVPRAHDIAEPAAHDRAADRRDSGHCTAASRRQGSGMRTRIGRAAGPKSASASPARKTRQPIRTNCQGASASA